MSDTEPLLPLREVAVRLGVPVQTFYGWRKNHTGPKGYRVGREIKFKWSDVEAWLETKAS